jgi:uncharacterized protein HemX
MPTDAETIAEIVANKDAAIKAINKKIATDPTLSNQDISDLQAQIDRLIDIAAGKVFTSVQLASALAVVKSATASMNAVAPNLVHAGGVVGLGMQANAVGSAGSSGGNTSG